MIQLVLMANEAPFVRISRALILHLLVMVTDTFHPRNLLGRVQPRYTKDSHAKAGKENEEEGYCHNAKLVLIPAMG